MESHPARALHQRLEDHRRGLVRHFVEKRVEPREPGFVGRNLDDMVPGQRHAGMPCASICSGSETAIAPKVSPW